MRSKEHARIGVTGVGGGVGQSVVRSLRSWSIGPRLVGFDMNPDSPGLFLCDAGHVLPPASHPGYADALLGHCVAEGINLLIPGSDPELLAISCARGAFADHGIETIIASPDVIRTVRNKQACCDFFQSHDVRFARTYRFPIAEDDIEALPFPLIVKPIDGSASRGVDVVLDAHGLRSLAGDAGLIAQEYLVPDRWGVERSKLETHDAYRGRILRQEDELSLQFVLDRDGRELGAFASRNKLTLGTPTVIEPANMPEHLALARRAVRALADAGLVGPCNLQARNTTEGLVFFEVNARFTGITAMRTAMGFREVEACARHWLFGEGSDQLAPILNQPEGLSCLRYVTEHIVSTNALNAMRSQFLGDGAP